MEKSISDTVPGGFTMCSMHTASPCYVLIPREANSDTFDTYSTDVAFGLVHHCYRGQEAERLFGSPLRCSYPTWNLELWALLGILQTSAMAQEPRHSSRIQSAAQMTRMLLPVYLLLCIPCKAHR